MVSEQRGRSARPQRDGVVLLVEDDDLVAHALKRSLQREGYEVFHAANVDEALPAFDANPIDVVVTDLLMPGGTGLDLLKKIEHRDPQVPVIITADHSVQAAAEAVREHAFDYLTKPVTRTRLSETVARAVASRRQTQIQQHEQERLREEHRQLEIRHQRTAMLLSVLFNRAVEGILVLDAEGRLVDASDSFVALVGKPLYELLDIDISDLFEPHPTEGNVQDRVVQLIQEPLSQGHWRGEVTVRAARSRHLPARMSLSVCERPGGDDDEDDSTQTRYVIALLYHEVAHEELSHHLQAADRLATMGLLAGSAAHEIKNELGPLVGYLSMIEQGGPAPVESETIRIMRDSVRRVREHVEQILAPLRPRVRTRGAVALRDSIDNILALLKRAGQLRRITMEREESDEIVVVHADKDEVHQIALNLITNAIDALGDGDGAEKGQIRISLLNRGDFGVLKVADTGCGIEEQLRARVFEPFFTTKGSAGTGLGLPVVHDIVRQLRGKVTLECPDGGGTIVSVSFPRYKP
ncbi:MAG: response regulator [Nannocystaceae bacterium]|nr:response regulator [Nannocystaceae bacterium]